MPAQELRQWNDASRSRQITPQRVLSLRRFLVFAAALTLTAAASFEMYGV